MIKQPKDTEEALGIIYHARERGDQDFEKVCKTVKSGVNETIVDELMSQKLICHADGRMELTKTGEEIALDVTRRHRLAERLLFDVLEMTKEHIDNIACEFEHIISPEVADSICTLLGHPKFCPHGSSIPPGNCCKTFETVTKSIVTPLTEFPVGEMGRISYIVTSSHPQLHKVLSLGVVPGVEVVLHQKTPSYVIIVGQTQIAMDSELAQQIYLRKV